MPLALIRRLVKGSPLTAAEHDSNLDVLEAATVTDLGYNPTTRLLSSSTGADVTLPLVTTTAAGLIPHTWLTGAEAAILPHIHGALAGVVYEHVRNVSGAPMAALTPYHVVGSQGDTDRVQIIPADASDPASMPASGILMTALANNEDGHGVIAGVPTGLNTAANPSGTVLYVGVGVLTPTAPAANVQAIAIVGRSHASTGTLSMIGGTSLGNAAYRNVGTTAGTVAAGDAVAALSARLDQFLTQASFGVVYSLRQTIAPSSGVYSLDVLLANEFVTSAAINGAVTVNLSNLASIPNGYVWRGVLRFAYTSGTVTWFSGNTGYTVKWDGGSAPTLTAGDREAVIIEVVGGDTLIEIAALRGRA